MALTPSQCVEFEQKLSRSLQTRKSLREFEGAMMTENIFKRMAEKGTYMNGAPPSWILIRHEMLDDDPENQWIRAEEDCEGTCAWPEQMIDVGEERQDAFEVKTSIRTPDFCIEKFVDLYEARTRAKAYRDALVSNASWLEFSKMRDAFGKMSDSMVATQDLPYERGRFPRIPATSTLTPEILRSAYRHLRVNEANRSPAGKQQGAALHSMLISGDAYEAIFCLEGKFNDMIIEVSPGDLNMAIVAEGTGKRIGNFIPEIIDEPRRFDWDPTIGDYRQIQPRISKPGFAGGKKSHPNPAYESIRTAPYEEVIFPNKESMRILTPETEMLGSGFDFDRQNYTAVPRWSNILTDCNKRGNQGHMFADIQFAISPKFNNRGLRLMIQRFEDPNKLVEGNSYKPGDNNTVKESTRHELADCAGCSQGPDDTSLYLTFAEALPSGVTDYNVVFDYETIKPATLEMAAPIASAANRYLFRFEEDISCACCGKLTYLTEVCTPEIGAKQCPADPCEDCGPNPDALTCGPATVPAGKASAININQAGLTVVPGDEVTVDFGSVQIVGEVVSYADPALHVAFNQIVSCETGTGVASVTAIPGATPVLACFSFPLDATEITAWTDGTNSLGGPVLTDVNYASVAAELNASIGESVFEATDTGVKYIGTEIATLGDLAINGAAVSPAAC